MRKFLIILCLLAATTGVAFSQAKVMSVTVKEAPVRATPSFLGKIVADLSYGAQVEVVETQSGWVKVNLPSGQGTGWLHSSELTEQKLAVKSGSNVNQSASGSEVALAGKGFNKQVEDQYKSEKNLDYTWVDKMEKISYKPQQLVTFLEEGDLQGGQN
ncbi:MAG TPA: SH3 domain-containing protein [Spirochaetia bacterium]|nr:SH3 domain-containing protein [Spirochaetia bacterium]